MRVIMTAGGTAGHINPALTIAKYIKKRRPESEILFVGAKGRLEERLVPEEGFILESIDIRGLSRSFSPRGVIDNAAAARLLLRSSSAAKGILDRFRPDVVIGTGGYASFPVLYAASKRGIPAAIHESNAQPGLTTRVLARYCDRVMVSFEETLGRMPAGLTVLTGNPLREGMEFGSQVDAKIKLGLTAKPVVVSFWGSLGAREMNRKMVDFMACEFQKGEFTHINATGSYPYDWIDRLMEEKGVFPERDPDLDVRKYITDMPDVMAAADLLLCRAGAMTLSEICAMGKAAIIVPSPNVTGNHQEKNARALERRGAAVVFLEKECTGASLYTKVRELLQDGEKRARMTEAARRMAITDGVERIYHVIEGLVAP